jgi:NAD-dependent SIR2 family protein deacetylase
VDGQFQKAGFAAGRICEIHGSIHHLQCATGCCDAIWPADDFLPEVDAATCRLTGDLPLCPRCGSLARPNVLMFSDWGWIGRRSEAQHARLAAWLAAVDRPLCIEIGAGTTIPSVRHFAENHGGRLIRINPDEAQVPDRHTAIGLPLGGREGIAALAAALAA